MRSRRSLAVLSLLGALLLACFVARFAIARVEIRPDRGISIRPSGLRLLAPEAGAIDTGVYLDDLSDEGRAFVMRRRRVRYGLLGDELTPVLERSISQGAVAIVAATREPLSIAAAIERERALDRAAGRSTSDTQLASVLRQRLRGLVERARACQPVSPNAPIADRECPRDLDDDVIDSLSRGLASLSPRDPELVEKLKARMDASRPGDADFNVALRMLVGLDAADEHVIDRLASFLKGSDLYARGAAMRALSSMPVHDVAARSKLRENVLTWVVGERPAQDWITDHEMAFSAMALALSLSAGEVDAKLFAQVLRRPARDLGADGFFYEDVTQRAVQILVEQPAVNDNDVRAAVKALCNDAIHNAKRLVADNPARFRRFWRALVLVADKEGVDPGKLVFAIFEGEGDFTGPAQDDPVLNALDVLGQLHPGDDPLGGGAVDLIRKRLKQPPDPSCLVARLAESFHVEAEARIKRCLVLGDPWLLQTRARITAGHLRDQLDPR